MMAESIMSISNVAFGTLIAAHYQKSSPLQNGSTSLMHSNDSDTSREKAIEDEADMKIVIGGLIFSCILCTILVAFIFGDEGIKWWATIIALFLASIFSILGVRALGETDLNP